MANADIPSGLKYLGNISAANANGQIQACTVLAADTTALFLNDAVKLTGTLGVNEDGEYFQVVTKAGVGEPIFGVVTSVQRNPSNLELLYRPASTLGTVFVVNDPYAKFEIQTSGTGAVGDAGNLADLVLGTPSTFTGVSGTELDQTTVGSGDQLRILDYKRTPDNDIGLNMKWIVQINTHELKAVTGV